MGRASLNACEASQCERPAKNLAIEEQIDSLRSAVESLRNLAQSLGAYEEEPGVCGTSKAEPDAQTLVETLDTAPTRLSAIAHDIRELINIMGSSLL